MNTTPLQSARLASDTAWYMFLTFAAVMAATMVPFDSFAAISIGTGSSSNGFTTVLCNAIDMFTGTTGKAVATIAVIAVGIGALLGKISWGMALIITIGIALIFGAAGIVSIIGNGVGGGGASDPACGGS